MYTRKNVKTKNYKKTTNFFLKMDKTNNNKKKYDKNVFPTIIHRWENKSVDFS